MPELHEQHLSGRRKVTGANLLSQVANAKVKDIAEAAFHFLSKLQDKPNHTIVGAISVMFLLMCDHFKVSPRDLLEYTEHLIKEAERRPHQRIHILAIRDFLGGEL